MRKRSFNVWDVIGLVAGILTPAIFLLAPLLTRSKFVLIFRDMNLSLPAVTSFYLNCPFVLFVIAGLIPGALMVFSTIFLTGKKKTIALASFLILVGLFVGMYVIALFLPLWKVQ